MNNLQLKAFRQGLGLTVAEAAEIAQVTKRSFQYWEAWQAAKAQANKQFENFIDQAIEDSACADERRSLQALLDEFQDIATIEAQEPAND